jgi:hypothetical protein
MLYAELEIYLEYLSDFAPIYIRSGFLNAKHNHNELIIENRKKEKTTKDLKFV